MGKNNKQKLIFIDTETTGLPKPIGTDINSQPYITEICAILTDHKLNHIDEFSALVDVPIEIEYFITKHTGISNKMLEENNAQPFAKHRKKIQNIFDKADVMVAQNLPFDLRMLEIDFQRCNKKFKPPPTKYCTVEQSLHFRGMRLNSKELHLEATGKPIVGIHRARADVIAMISYYQYILTSIPKHFTKVI